MNDALGADAAFPGCSPGAFAKLDGDDDADFYAQARLVTHIDTTAIATLTDFYRLVLAGGGHAASTLMSSWVSHLLDDVNAYAEVIGHGMNAAELTANPRLAAVVFVRDLQPGPHDPSARCQLRRGDDLRFDPVPAAACGGAGRSPAGAQTGRADRDQLFQPLLSHQGGRPVWRALDGTGHARLVVDIYLRRAGFAETEIHRLIEGWASDPLTAVVGRSLDLDDLS